MNKVILMGRLTKDPDISYSQSQNPVAIARYTLAVDRRRAKENEQSADFISCVAFGKGAEFAEKYLHKGSKIALAGHIQTGSYTNRDNQKVYTTDVVVEEQEFAESKSGGQTNPTSQGTQPLDQRNPQPQGYPLYGGNAQMPQGYQPNGNTQAPQGLPQEFLPAGNAQIPQGYASAGNVAGTQNGYPGMQQGYQPMADGNTPWNGNVSDDELPFK